MKTGVVFGALFIALLATAVLVIELVRVPDMYAVEGHGSIKYRPDSAHVSVGVVARSDVATDASIQAAKGMSEVLAALRAAGISDRDIATSQVEAGLAAPSYSAPTSAPRLPSYAADQAVQITVTDLKLLPMLLNTVVGAGANYWRVDFFVANENDFKRKVRDAALADAIERATSYAAKGGFARGRILKIQEGQTQFPYTDYGSRSFVINLQEGIETGLPALSPRVEKVTVTGARLRPDFVVPRPEEAEITATIGVLFEIR